MSIAGLIWWMIVALLARHPRIRALTVARRWWSQGAALRLVSASRCGRAPTATAIEFAIAAIPLAAIAERRRGRRRPRFAGPQAFNRKPILQRIAVVAAGPITT
jgi:regulator of sigma E protease